MLCQKEGEERERRQINCKAGVHIYIFGLQPIIVTWKVPYQRLPETPRHLQDHVSYKIMSPNFAESSTQIPQQEEILNTMITTILWICNLDS